MAATGASSDTTAGPGAAKITGAGVWAEASGHSMAVAGQLSPPGLAVTGPCEGSESFATAGMLESVTAMPVEAGLCIEEGLRIEAAIAIEEGMRIVSAWPGPAIRYAHSSSTPAKKAVSAG
ncbi:hypothetical protein [Streptomyces sp. NPDC001903]|uniref:hypothetical protein n=1 Tax=Streptomyces sp. NPDC001903 TaxID=3364622 RepID=UPI0036C97EF7